MQRITAKLKFLPLAAVIISFIGLAPFAAAGTLLVGPETEYETIDEALEAAVAGDIIQVGAGTYAENVVIDKDDITLTGLPGAVITVAETKTGVHIAADNVTVENLTIEGPYPEPFTGIDWTAEPDATTGIWAATGATGVNIRNNTIVDIRTGIQVYTGSEVDSITGNLIDNTKGSILLRADVPVISGNSTGTVGSEWDIVVLVSVWSASPAAMDLLPDQTDMSAYSAAVMALSAANGDMSILDRRFADTNRTHAYVAQGANPGPTQDFGLGNGLGNVRQPYGGVQHGVTAVVEGGTVFVANGTYAESLTLAKPGVVIYADDAILEVAAGNANGITVQADGLELHGLNIDKAGSSLGGSGIFIGGSVTRNDLTLTDISVTGFVNGLFVDDPTSVDDLYVTNSQFNNNRFGWYLSKSPVNASNVVDVEVSNTTFNNNTSKALYVEKLSDAVFDQITVDDSGTDNVSWPPSNGVDINLKWSAYTNITIQNSDFINSGHYAATPLGDLSGAVVIKARDDDPPSGSNYTTPPASLDGLFVLNNTFTSNEPTSLVGLRLGEPLPTGSSTDNINEGPTGVVIEGNTFTGFERPLLNITEESLAVTTVRANTFNGNSVVVAHNNSVSGVYDSLSAALTAAPAGATLDLAGDFTQATVALNKAWTLNGNGVAKLTGKIDISSNDVAVTGMEITNPSGIYGIQAKGVSNIIVSNNNVHDIGTTVTGSAQAIYVYGTTTTPAMNNIEISGNYIENVGNNSSTSSTKGIHLGDSNAVELLSNVVISGNTIRNVMVPTKGAYGISVNYGASGAGSVTGLDITDNDISGLTGSWVHGIGLETDTAEATVTGNIVTGLNASGIDEAAVFFESNTHAASVVLTDNDLSGGEFGVALHPTNMPGEIVVDASSNWWGSATSPEARVGGNVVFTPWYINSAMTVLSNAPVEPEPEPEPDPGPGTTTPDTDPEEEVTGTIEEINDIDIQLPDDGTELSEETVEQVNNAANTAAGLATSIVETIATVETNTAVEALNAISSVVDITAAAANSTSGSSQPSQSANVVNSGTTALNSFSTLLTAIDSKTNSTSTPAAPLTGEQKTAVQGATVKAAVAAVQILRAADPEKKQEVLQALGKIITSNVNLGVPLTTTQTATLLDAADQAGSTPGNPNGPIGIEVKPVNKELISKDVLSEALEGSGIGEEELDSFLEELANAINPADVRLGNIDGETALEGGFTGAVGGGAIAFDKATGTIVFTLTTTTTPDTASVGRRSFAQTVERNIPARVVSSNIVASTFPDGLVTRADGAVIITSQRIASIVVPASYDPINMFADLRSLGTVSVDTSGNVTIVRPGVLHFSGTFDFVGVTAGSAPVEKTTLNPSSGGDASDPNFVYTVTYRDGTQQTIQPFIAADNFVQSVTGRGLNVAIVRNTGVITVEGMRFRPAYFVEAHTTQTRAWWNSHKDASGLAYRINDENSDGLPDYEVHSETGVQVAYRLP